MLHQLLVTELSKYDGVSKFIMNKAQILYVDIIEHLVTYRYWRDFRSPNEESIGPFNPLEFKCLQRSDKNLISRHGKCTCSLLSWKMYMLFTVTTYRVVIS